MRARALLVLGLVFVSGCGSETLAPVSGTVTLNGKPLAGAIVSYTPIVERKGIEAPLGSSGKTNEKGEYTLETNAGRKGALVAKHKVSISIVRPEIGESDARPPRGGWPMKDKIPPKYNENTELTCEVPPGGRNDANFDLKVSPEGGPKK
jgi:hypothetical protein